MRKNSNLDSQGFPFQNSRVGQQASFNRDFQVSASASPGNHPRIQDSGFKGAKPKKNLVSVMRSKVTPQQSRERIGEGLRINLIDESQDTLGMNLLKRSEPKREEQ